jgi:hypothetical protein
MPTQKLTDEILTAAIDGFEVQKSRLDAQIAELRQMLSGNRLEPEAGVPSPKRRRKMSRAARARIAAAQRKRWAAKKQSATTSTVTLEPKRKKRRLSAAGRRAIVEATKRRWALITAQAKKVAKRTAA